MDMPLGSGTVKYTVKYKKKMDRLRTVDCILFQPRKSERFQRRTLVNKLPSNVLLQAACSRGKDGIDGPQNYSIRTSNFGTHMGMAAALSNLMLYCKPTTWIQRMRTERRRFACTKVVGSKNCNPITERT